MPETIPDVRTTSREYDVQIRRQHHGFVVVNTRIHDPGRGRHITLEIAGATLKASIAVEVLRSAPNLSGLWRATLDLRSSPTGRLEGTQFVRRLRLITAALSEQPAFWTCTGEVARVDREAEMLELRVQTGHRGHGIYTVTASIPRSLLERLEGAQFAHLTGSLDGLRLVASQAEAVTEQQLETQGRLGREQTSRGSLTVAKPNLEGLSEPARDGQGG